MQLLSIYVQDHLALSLAGIRLARRCLAENRGTPLGAFLARLVPELEDDREALKEVARAVGTGPSAMKEAAAALGELAGRFKPNGRVVGYSELSRVWELEALMAGTDSRRGLWTVVAKVARRIPALQGVEPARREERARRQHEELDRRRVRAAEAAFLARRRAAGSAAAAAAAR
jgi:hypothetical protein